ncbi:DNA adenine methylase [Calothrix sp. UHCC 0171]|uniref:DNA adenine methylase n=1 Tax=Calothrix sp. UHCC 0171 TaxID=3110245 RepID=UPI002B1F9CDF|nr:DNA adenine methylase [Calothrix sp. UHCC 0171]MEA5570058.1 DNA adenine methylase [Calothrix sp. UHCC 0171]
MLLSSLSTSSLPKPKPFLKWAGGKGKLIEQMSHYFPQGLIDGSIKRYVEPFIGGGAVFFYLASNYEDIKEFYLFDINPELILAYQTIQQNVEELIEELSSLQTEYFSLSSQEQTQYFYKIRTNFNSQKQEIDFHNYSPSWIQRTAQIIFLNRTCYNGLFRVNSKGYFNVPVGRYKNPKICNKENLFSVSEVLKKAVIKLGDFELSKQFSDSSTFTYFDPPYRPISKTSNFTSYSENNFSDTEQLKLSRLFKQLDAIGVKLMLSNSDPKNQDQNDNFFDDIYSEYKIERIKAARSINSNSSKRGEIKELLIMNY